MVKKSPSTSRDYLSTRNISLKKDSFPLLLLKILIAIHIVYLLRENREVNFQVYKGKRRKCHINDDDLIDKVFPYNIQCLLNLQLRRIFPR